MATYSISLDDVDLALLPAVAHSQNDFLKKEYFHFQVMKTETVKESTPIILYTCHICAVEVPAAFASEHASSIKHQANARIANVAAERTRALISALPVPFAEQSDAPFCANCSTIVTKNHDKTKEHRVAVLQDKLLWQLMAAYVGDDNDNDGDLNSGVISDYISEHKGNSEDHNKLELNIKVSEKNKCDEIHGNDQLIDNKVLKIQNDEKRHNNVDSTLDNKIINIDTGTNESNNKLRYSIDTCNKIRERMECRARNTQVVTAKTTQGKFEYDDFVPDTNKFIKVSTDHYHSFIGKVGEMECIVCKRTFNCEEALSRAFSLRHPETSKIINRIEKQINIINDEIYVTKVNDKYSYCNACNQVVRNSKVYDHNLTLHHRNNKVKKLVRTVASTDDDKINVTNNNKQASQNVDDNVKDQAKDIAGKRQSRSRKRKKTNTPEENVKNTISCEVNNVDNWKFLEEFFKTNTPVVKVNNTANSSEVTNTDNWKLLEEVFKTDTPEEKVKNTAESSKEKNVDLKLSEDVFKDNTPKEQFKSTESSSEVKNTSIGNDIDEFCKYKTPKEKLKNTAGSEKEKPPNGNVMAGSSGLKLSKETQMVVHAFEKTDDEKLVRCVICDCTVPNALENRTEHLIGTRHANSQRNMKVLSPSAYVYMRMMRPTAEHGPPLMDERESAVGSTLAQCGLDGTGQVSYPFEITQRENMLCCVICDCYVPNNVKNRQEHLLGSSHIDKQFPNTKLSVDGATSTP